MCYEIVTDMNYATEFQTAFGMRFVGLEDAVQTVYNTYRVPDPQAPFPQDYIIDAAGVVRYWSDEYDPQEILAVLQSLLGPPAGVAESPTRVEWISAAPNPFTKELRIRFLTPGFADVPLLQVLRADGANVRTLVLSSGADGHRETVWDGRDARGHVLPSGAYWLRATGGPAHSSRRVILIR